MTTNEVWFWGILVVISVFLVIRHSIKESNELIERHGLINHKCVTWKGKTYLQGKEIGDKVLLLDVTRTRGVRSFFVNKDQLGK